MSDSQINRSKLRNHLRLLNNDTIFAMLDEAIELLPPAKLQRLVGRYLSLPDLDLLGPEPKADTPARLRAAAESFAVASRRGDYFQAFDVNSKNCHEQSKGTTAWIGDVGRLLDRCVALSARTRGVADVLIAFEQLFEVVEQAASCECDMLFFADEGGIWEFGISWREVGAAWMSCVARAEAAGNREDRIARLVERCGGETGDVGRELVKARLRVHMPLT
jgi:hypothetical protein